MTWTGKPTIKAGAYPTGAQLEAMIDQIDTLTGPGWITYTPAWTGGGGNPAIGNGTLTGRYRFSSGADLVEVRIRVTAGSTTTFGSGFYAFGLPTAAQASAGSQSDCCGACYMLDSGTLDKIGIVKIETTSIVQVVSATGGVITPTVPHTWANGDIIRIEIAYEPA